MEEYELIDRAKNKDLESFNILVLKYQDKIFAHVYYLLQNYDAAEDITQEAFLLAFQKLYQFRGGSFRAWLLRIATNLSIDEFRSRKGYSLLPLELSNSEGELYEIPLWTRDTQTHPEEAIVSGELRAALEYGLMGLPEYYRNAVNLVDIQQLSYKEAATTMGISIGTLKSRLKRGRNQLRNNFIYHSASYESEHLPINLSA